MSIKTHFFAQVDLEYMYSKDLTIFLQITAKNKKHATIKAKDFVSRTSRKTNSFHVAKVFTHKEYQDFIDEFPHLQKEPLKVK